MRFYLQSPRQRTHAIHHIFYFVAHNLTSKIFRIIVWVIISLVALVFMAVGALYIPAVQTMVKDFALEK